MQRGAEIKSPAGPRWAQGLFSGIAILSNTLRLGAAETESKMILLERLEPRVHLSGDGLLGTYYNDTALTDVAGTRIDATINWPNDGLGNNATGMVTADDEYSIRWMGWVQVAQAGQWTFTTFSNDGVRLWVNDTQLIINWTQHVRTEDNGTINLAAGWHPIKLEYYQQAGVSDLELRYSGPGFAQAIIPQASLSSSDPVGLPTVNAGPDRTVILPTNSLTLNGSASDNGSISAYLWTQLSGPNTANLSDANTQDLSVSGLVQGTYEFQLRVTDNESNIAFDTAMVNVISDAGGDAMVSGELRTWHKVTLTWDGPQTSETAAVNPFTDYRLDVRFTGPSGQVYVVPGYFAADGDAANTGASSGNKWRAHLAPDEAGQWTYSVSFRTGGNVAVDDNPLAGSTAGFFDSDTGTLTVLDTDKTGRDMRAKGMLEYVGERYLKFAGTGEYFLKQGPDAPENLLAYEDFDNTPNIEGRRKSYAPHANDWNLGDPSWMGGKGTELIGAINYLASEGLNSISFIPMNINGDDKNVFPYISDSSANRTRIDVSKVSQWEIVFEHATEQGFFLHFKTQETENELLLDGGDLGTQRKVYYRELIARFGHHPALNWNLGEEINNATTAQKKAWADYFWNNDPYQHHIVIHNGANHYDLLGPGFNYTGFSLQTNNADFSQDHASVLNYLNRSANAGKIWAVAIDEPGDAEHALRPDNDAGNSHIDGRKNSLWGALLAGAWGNEWYFGYSHAESDLTLQDFRSRDSWWDYTRYALEFFNDNAIPYWEMNNDNNISSASNDYGFYKPGEVYVAYLKNGGTTNIDLSAASGELEVKWYDPRNGGALQNGTVTTVTGGASRGIGQAPNNISQDWVVLVRKPLVIQQGPLGGAPRVIGNGSLLQFEDYDEGGEGKAFHDSDGISQGDPARQTGVDGGSGVGAVGEVIAWTVNGEWLEYTISPVAGTYYASLRYASGHANPGTLKMLLGDGPEGTNFTTLATFDPVNTGGFNEWAWLTIPGITLPGGSDKVLRFEIVGGNFNLDFIEFTTNAPVNTPPTVNIDGFQQVTTGTTGNENVFQDQGGYVIMEVESHDATGGWAFRNTDPTGATGSGFYEWQGPNLFGQNQAGTQGLMEYKFQVDSAGTYQMRIRNHRTISAGEADDTENDVWAKMDNGPWYKVYSGTKNQWNWNSNFDLFDLNGTRPAATYDLTAGEHTFYLSGRSQYFRIDRIAIFQSNQQSIAQNTSTPESPQSGDEPEVVGYQINATVTDDARLFYPPQLTWSKVSGPGNVVFDNPNAEDVVATFSIDGLYTLKLTAYEGQHTVSDTITLYAGTQINTTPTVDAGSNITVPWPGMTADLDGTVGDDGLPIPPGSVSVQWSKVSGPGSVTFANANLADTQATFSMTGQYVLRLSASDGDLSAYDDVTVDVQGNTSTQIFSSMDDAYLEDSTRINNEYLKIEDATRQRTSYVKFNLTGLAGRVVENASLTFTVAGDAGSGTLQLWLGSHNSWTEGNLSTTNAPTKQTLLNTVTGTHALGNKVTFDVTDAIAGDGSVTFILNIVAGNDVSFSSSEGASGPELVIESSASQVEVMDRQVFHNNSALDGNNPAANLSDDQAIASDKQALLGGETAGLANFTSYSKGLNGIMIDIQNLPATSLSAADFIFRTGSDNNPAGWATAPAPVSITVRPGDGVNGSHRVTLIWADNNQDGIADAHEAIANGWLQVTVLPTANTGLTSEDVFYFGNLPGDATGDGVTNAYDLLRVRQNYLMPPGDGRDNTADLTMDGNVNAFDLLAVRQNYLQSLTMITTPAPPLPMTLVTTGFVQTFETLANQPATAQPAPVVEQLQVEPVSTPASGASAQIVASFNKTVSVVPQALELVSSIGARVQLPVFRFDTVTRTASWTTAGLTDGRYQGVIRSSSVLSNGVSMLRDFQFRFRLTGSTITELQVDTSSPGNNGLSV